jgi:hypothetical protein
MKAKQESADNSFPQPGELRAWTTSCGRSGTFMVVRVDGFRVDVVLSDGKRDGLFRPYLMNNSYAISED